eukprot:scaffold8449_cov277-Pinguiococcus_pyrenoidosus.AAC.5
MAVNLNRDDVVGVRRRLERAVHQRLVKVQDKALLPAVLRRHVRQEGADRPLGSISVQGPGCRGLGVRRLRDRLEVLAQAAQHPLPEAVLGLGGLLRGLLLRIASNRQE